VIDIKFLTNILKNEKTITTVFLIAGIILFAYILLSLRLEDIANTFNALGFNIIILCLILVGELIVKSVRFKLLLKRITDVSFSDVFRIVFETTLFVAYSPGKAGEIMKLDLFKKHGVGRTDTFAAIIVERASDLAMVILFSMGLLFTFDMNLYPIILIAAAGTVSIIALYKSNLLRGVVSRVFRSIKRFGDWKTILMLCILTPLLWLSDAFIPYFTLKALGYNISFMAITPLYFVSMLIGLISMIPGGLGSSDFSFSYTLSSLMGVSKSDAFITIIISRIVAFIVCFAGSILYFKEFRGARHGG
jgi:uncharacterized membrane protein YbhN (UPF0104 family)